MLEIVQVRWGWSLSARNGRKGNTVRKKDRDRRCGWLGASASAKGLVVVWGDSVSEEKWQRKEAIGG